MKKDLIVGIIVMIVLIILGVGYYYYSNSAPVINVADVDSFTLAQHALSQKEVIKILEEDKLSYYDVTSSQPFSTQGPTYPGIYGVMNNIDSPCLKKVELGDLIRVVRIHTATHNIDVIYSSESNKIVCLLHYDRSPYVLD